jgi:hypothetical protein
MVPIGRQMNKQTAAGYTESTEPSPQSADKGGLNDFVGSKTAERLGLDQAC